jgi:hypothetical protein
MSIAKRNAIENIKRLIPDEILREQLIDLHLGKLTEDQIRELREEREREAEEMLRLFATDLSFNHILPIDLSGNYIQNGETEVCGKRDN